MKKHIKRYFICLLVPPIAGTVMFSLPTLFEGFVQGQVLEAWQGRVFK